MCRPQQRAGGAVSSWDATMAPVGTAIVDGGPPMSVLSWPDHLLTLPEWDALPDDNRYRLEVVEGVLLVAPRPLTFHQRAVTRLGYLINEQLPPELCALSEVDLILTEHPLTVRSPDVLVTTTVLADTNPARYRPEDVFLTVEVLSEGKRAHRPCYESRRIRRSRHPPLLDRRPRPAGHPDRLPPHRPGLRTVRRTHRHHHPAAEQHAHHPRPHGPDHQPRPTPLTTCAPSIDQEPVYLGKRRSVPSTEPIRLSRVCCAGESDACSSLDATAAFRIEYNSLLMKYSSLRVIVRRCS